MKPFLFLFLFLVSSLDLKITEASGTGNWGYTSTSDIKGPSDWKDINPTCDGARQSPIDIVTRSAVYLKDLQRIEIKKIDNFANFSTLERHETSIYLKLNNSWGITFGGNQCLRPDSIHWHWGSKGALGSEHSLDGKHYPIEGHLLSYNCMKYSSLNEAKSSPEGLYVIGIFYKIGPKNVLIDKIIPAMQNLSSSTNISSVIISEISVEEILPKNLDKYYQYDGSLTTPPCTENVRWTVLNEELTIDESQLEVFRQFDFESPNSGKMENNFRPILSKFNEKRTIYSSFKTGLTVKFNEKILLGVLCAIFMCLQSR